MKRKHVFPIAVAAILALTLLSATSCKTSGMAVTSRGHIINLDITAPKDLPNDGVDNLDVSIGNMGVNNMQDILLEVEMPPQLIVMDQTSDRGVDVFHTPGTNMYRFTFGNIQAGERSTVRFRVQTAFGSMEKTSVKATAWQEALPGDKLVESAMIKLRH
ncbi:MAG TPA: hypothetical protein VNA69_02890 [Thermoanaerobaculia bacterium]|nr:hypothetical protein [Thermoanaerobaculia bacterium]